MRRGKIKNPSGNETRLAHNPKMRRTQFESRADKQHREAVLADLDIVWREMAVERPPEDNAAETVLAVLVRARRP